MKCLRYPMFAVFIFVIGVAISPIRFDLEGIGCGRVIDGGGGFSVSSYRSSYFVRLVFEHEGYLSEGKANEVFNQRLRQAAKVIEVTPKLNKDGVIVGQRAVGILFDPQENRSFAFIFWTDGRLVHSIHSTSMLHVIEFEKHELGVYGRS